MNSGNRSGMTAIKYLLAAVRKNIERSPY